MLAWEVTFTALDGAKRTEVLTAREQVKLVKASAGPFLILGQIIYYNERHYWKARLVEEESTGSLLPSTDQSQASH